MSQDADNLYIARTKAVAGCFSMFLLMFGLTFTPLFSPRVRTCLPKGYFSRCCLHWNLLCWFRCITSSSEKERGWAKAFSTPWFTILFAALLFIQLILPLILGLRQTEAWVTSQISLSSYALWLSTLTLIFIAPVYEEIVFRGCLFNAFQYWFNNKTAVVSGGIGHFCHHAYAVCGSTDVADVVSCVAGFDHRQTEKQRPVDADHAAYSDERDGYCSANGSPDVTT